MPLILGANQLTAGGYEVDNSLRFNNSSSDSLTRTAGTFTSRDIFTVSAWVKFSGIGGTNQNPIISFDGSNQYMAIRFGSTSFDFDNISYQGSTIGRIISSAVYRDFSAWYHVLVAIDSTQATASNRMRSYINGVEVTVFSSTTYPTQNTDMISASMTTIRVGAGVDQTGTTSYFGGYMAEVYYIDGQQLDPSYFGEFDEDTNIWKPIPYTGSFGTNGFYLEFKNSASLGTDSSGNGNTFTVNNLTSIDQTTDTPTNNFCTLNPLDNGNSNILTTNGNVSVSSSTTWDRGIKATFGVSSGKWYWEYKHGTVNSGTNPAADLGITKYSSLINSAANGGATNTDSYFIGGADGSKYNGSYTPTSYGSAFTTGDIAIIALDMDNGKFYMGKNGTWFNSGNPATSTNPAFTSLSGTFLPVWYWGISAGTSGVLISDFNFGNPPFTISSGNADANGFGNFEYAVPSGYFALCTKNLADYG